eukprot:7131998-Prymnesium_polylepis.1
MPEEGKTGECQLKRQQCAAVLAMCCSRCCGPSATGAPHHTSFPSRHTHRRCQRSHRERHQTLHTYSVLPRAPRRPRSTLSSTVSRVHHSSSPLPP